MAQNYICDICGKVIGEYSNTLRCNIHIIYNTDGRTPKPYPFLEISNADMCRYCAESIDKTIEKLKAKEVD